MTSLQIRFAVTPLRIFLISLFVVLIIFQTLSFPGQFAHMAKESPQDAYLRWPLTAITAFWILCIQIVIVCTWKLLTLVKNNRIFTEASLLWVDVIVWAIAAAWVVFSGALFYVVINADDPGLPFLMFFVWIGIAVIGLLMIVMRALLRQATALQTDMEAVI